MRTKVEVIEFNLATDGPRVWAPFSGWPTNLDPRWDFLRSDDELERVHADRMGVVAAEARRLSDGRAIDPLVRVVPVAPAAA